MKKSTFIKLGVVAALVMLPRRSSKKAGCTTGCGCSKSEKTDDKSARDTTSTNTKSCDCKNCKCPLCRIGKCPLCAIGKCFCCKKSSDKSNNKGCCVSDKKAEK